MKIHGDDMSMCHSEIRIQVCSVSGFAHKSLSRQIQGLAYDSAMSSKGAQQVAQR
jgi:hypothetical protein